MTHRTPLLCLDVTQDSTSMGENLNYSNGNTNALGKDTEADCGHLMGRFVSKNVVNSSRRELVEYEISLLSKGLNCIPTPLSIKINYSAIWVKS